MWQNLIRRNRLLRRASDTTAPSSSPVSYKPGGNIRGSTSSLLHIDERGPNRGDVRNGPFAVSASLSATVYLRTTLVNRKLSELVVAICDLDEFWSVSVVHYYFQRTY